MKLYVTAFILLISVKCFSQDYYTIVAKNYVLSYNGKETKINGVISLTYSKEYSVLYIQGKSSLSFENEQYTRDLVDGGLHENFLSGETNTTLSGHYSISVYQRKNNNAIVIGSFTTRTSYFAEHAQLYSENGKVDHNPYVENWKELFEKEKAEKEKLREKKDSQHKQDSINDLNTKSIDRDEVFTIVEQMPEFPGGEVALRNYIAKAIVYPTVAKENGIQGKVSVTFVVNKDGSVSNAKIARGVDASLDAEAIRIVYSLPKWSPGKQKGEVVAVSYTVPVSFKIQ